MAQQALGEFEQLVLLARRLEQRGLISSWMSDPSPERGGKARRCVNVKPAGLEALRESRRVLAELWKGLDPALAGAE